MITVTESAKSAMWETLRRNNMPWDAAFRLGRGSDGPVLDVDRPADGDRVISHRNAPVLVIDRDFDEGLGRAVVDLSVAGKPPAFSFRPVPPEDSESPRPLVSTRDAKGSGGRIVRCP
ncbi:MAG: hypothetical protein ACE5Q6_18655, partial [Dehalococcoidia bacterium]